MTLKSKIKIHPPKIIEAPIAKMVKSTMAWLRYPGKMDLYRIYISDQTAPPIKIPAEQTKTASGLRYICMATI